MDDSSWIEAAADVVAVVVALPVMPPKYVVRVCESVTRTPSAWLAAAADVHAPRSLAPPIWSKLMRRHDTTVVEPLAVATAVTCDEIVVTSGVVPVGGNR